MKIEAGARVFKERGREGEKAAGGESIQRTSERTVFRKSGGEGRACAVSLI